MEKTGTSGDRTGLGAQLASVLLGNCRIQTSRLPRASVSPHVK